MTVTIHFESVDFPHAGPVSNGHASLATSWDELLWSALTVGRPNRNYVFAHGQSSYYEALFRLSLVRMALEQTSPRSRRLRRTQAAKTLDPSEKGAINYFLGLAVAKLFAYRLLDVPWLLHLDVFRPQLNPVLTGRSRPDLVGQTFTGDWVAVECKGRLSKPDSGAKDRAKGQANRLLQVSGVAPSYHIGAIAFFAADTLTFWWRDPEPPQGRPITVEYDPTVWRHHYQALLGLIHSDPEGFERMLHEETRVLIENADIEVGIHPKVLRALVDDRWDEARRVAGELEVGDTYRRDGTTVVAGRTWFLPFREFSPTEGS